MGREPTSLPQLSFPTPAAPSRVFLSGQAAAAAAELHRVLGDGAERAGGAAGAGPGALHVRGAHGQDLLEYHVETRGLLPAAPG